MSTKELIESAVDHLQATASVKKVYGEPVVVDGKTVIPVAKVAMGFGGGAGHRKSESATGTEQGPAEAGEGAGGGVRATPIGVVEISGQETRFIPFAQTRKLTISALVGSGIGLGLGWLLHRRAGKH